MADGVLTLSRGESDLLATNLEGRLTHLSIEPDQIAVTLPETVAPNAYLRLPGLAGSRILLARIGEREALWTDDGVGITFDDLGPEDAGCELRVILSR